MAASNDEDWRFDCNDIAAMQNKAKDEARFTDIQFVMGVRQLKRVFNAHKAILACGSPVFEKMFYGALAEKRNIIETDDDPEAFEMLLNYIYGKCIRITSLIFAWKYFTIGDKHLVPEIQESARQCVKSVSLNENGFWEIIESNIFSSPLFDDKIKSFIMENATKVLNSEKFLSVPEAIVNTIIVMEKINVSELELLLAVTKLGYRNLALSTTKSLKKFYMHIRFSTFTKDEFFHFIETYNNAIDAESSLAILQHLHCPTRHSLPKWCCTHNVSRITGFKNPFYQQGYMDRQYDLYARW